MLWPTGMRVAVKTFCCGVLGDVSSLKKVFREVHLWSKLHHKNVVPLLGITMKFDFMISIVSEWMGLGDAFTYVQNLGADPCPLLLGTAKGLKYLHSHELGPIFHGDLKGENAMVSDDGHAMLADFGLSCLKTSTFSMTVDMAPGGDQFHG
ncbi:hypothetical protein ID866_10368 [Astraeus odoratus]|nr:hypothetical protein ID866_10368 [Astraeus odoratus]